MDLNTIFFIGPQGSGKGTQAKLLAAKLGFFHWDMGGILREVAASDTVLGKKVKNQIDSGVLLGDDLLLEVAQNKLKTISPSTGVVFDGIPRRLWQAEFLMDFLKKQGRTEYATIFLDIPKNETLKRLLLRAEKEKRADDTREKIEFRLEQYYQDTLPVIEYLKNQTQFFAVEGHASIGEVTNEINKTLGLS
jgi:adenylate kinase